MNNRELIKIFIAMGNERRFFILKHLLNKKELSVGQIAELINLSFKSVSSHLAVLYGAELIDVRQSGLNRFYSIKTGISKDIVKFLN